MTVSEQYNEIGRRYVERQEIKRQLICVGSKLDRMRDKLEAAVSAIRNRAEHSEGIDADLPTCVEIVNLMAEEGKLQDKLKELDTFFTSLD